MSIRLTKADRVAATAGALSVLVAFLPWYSYTLNASTITVNGFRASLLGDVFFLAGTATILLLLMHRGVLPDVLRRRISQPAAYAILAGIAIASVLDQLLLVSGGHRSLGPGLILALFAAAGIGAAAWLRA